MAHVNKITLVGNLRDDPKTTNFQSGDLSTRFSLATSERWMDKRSGQPAERVQWHQVVVKDQRLAKLASECLKKGSQVYVEGAMEYREFTDRETGAKRPVAEVVVGPFRGDIQLLDRKQGPG